ncbi:MAG: NAD(+) synthase [Clostridiales bacterium]|nr:NAD(+) synthase [Clostridiales bacterium]
MNYGFVKVGTAVTEVTVADCKDNTKRIIAAINEASEKGVKVLCFPELSVTGYTCGDLFYQTVLLKAAERSVLEVAEASRSKDILVAIGFPYLYSGKIYNCAAVVFNGEILGIIPKTHVPNYAEFYEGRYFTPALERNMTATIGGREVPFGCKLLFSCSNIPGLVIGVEICEDLWVADNPSVVHAKNGANVIINLSAGDETIGKAAYRRSLVSVQSAKLSCAYIYAGAGEGESTQDMVFSGHSIICENGRVLAESKLFENSQQSADIDVERLIYERARANTSYSEPDAEYKLISFTFASTDNKFDRTIDKYPFVPQAEEKREEVCNEILTMQAIGLKKRLEHTHTKTAVIGVSGGLDSTLALLVAVKAFDMCKRSRKDIVAVTMPCFGTTARTKSNAEMLCEHLGVTLRTVNISEAVKVHFRDIGQAEDNYDVTFENAQARERTQVLMDISNQTGGMVIGTGDLSELALGWATYNGDHMSMYGVNASIPKTLIRHIVKFAADTAGEEGLAETLQNILDTPVSPELLPPDNGDISQKTENIVGPYDLHDFFLYYLVRFGFSPKKILFMAEKAFADMFEPDVIKAWLKIFIRRFFAQQFKRSCLPDGPKVGSVTLSPRGDWRMPSDAASEEWLAEI